MPKPIATYEHISTLAAVIQITYWLDNFNESHQKEFIEILQTQLKLPVQDITSTCNASASFYKFITKQTVITRKMNRKYYNICKALAKNYKSEIVPNNQLSSLPVVTIAHLGTFLTKQQSICLGHVDRTLYITTQTETFMMRRYEIKETAIFHLTSSKISSLCSLPWIKCGFTYCFPYRLKLRYDNDDFFIFISDHEKMAAKVKEQMQTIQSDYHKNRIFRNFFARLRTLIIEDSAMEYFSYLPVQYIFNKNLKESITLRLGKPTATIDIFCAKYQQYQNKCTNQNAEISLIRQIDSLQIQRDRKCKCKKFIKCLKRNFTSLTLGSEDGWSVPTVQEIKDWMLHPGLQTITLKSLDYTKAMEILLAVGKLQSSVLSPKNSTNLAQYLDKIMITFIKNNDSSVELSLPSQTQSSDAHEARLAISNQELKLETIKSAWVADEITFDAFPTTIVCDCV